MDDQLDDAQLLFDRAQAHRRELNHFIAAGPGLLWDIRRSTSPGQPPHAAELVLDRRVLRQTKPIIGDIANNLVHALDHVAAAAQRQADTGKKGRLYFPIAQDDAIYSKRIAEVRQFVGTDWADLFTSAREQHRLFLRYLKTIKQLSNEAKHWELRPGIAGALAVQWFSPEHRIEDIPAGHFDARDSFPFWKGNEPFADVAVQIVTGLRISGEDLDEVDLESALSTSSNFVAKLIGAARKYLATSRNVI